MNSLTTEAMGIASDFPTAFGKAQAAAGVRLPTAGSVFITVTDTDKPAATQLAARFHDLGADFYDNRTSPQRKTRAHVRQLEALGFKVTLEPAA